MQVALEPVCIHYQVVRGERNITDKNNWLLSNDSLSPEAKVSDRGRVAEAGEDPKNRIRMLTPAWQNTYYLEQASLVRVFL